MRGRGGLDMWTRNQAGGNVHGGLAKDCEAIEPQVASGRFVLERTLTYGC